jgi:DNA-binding MarR family transcriptional regulator
MLKTMHMDDLDRDLGFLLHDVARLMRTRFEQNAHDLGLTRSQAQVLVHLANNEGIHQGALAEKLDVEPITLTRILDRLEEAGLVERLLYRRDRRVRLLRLTAAAHPLIDDIFVVGALTRGEALDGIAEEDRDRLFGILSSMKTNLLARLTTAGQRRVSHG